MRKAISVNEIGSRSILIEATSCPCLGIQIGWDEQRSTIWSWSVKSFGFGGL